MSRERRLSPVWPSEGRSGSGNAVPGLSQGETQVERSPPAENLLAVRPVTLRADADTSLQRKDLGMVFGQSPLPTALRQASTDPSECPRQLPQIAPDWQTRGS